MDKFNVITPTSNLEELENDMANWSMLPFKFRMRANDQCIAQYNMTVPELYGAIKARIIKYTSHDSEESNLVSEMVEEDVDLNSAERRAENIKISDEANKSPFIVIIDPWDSVPEDPDLEQEMLSKMSKMWNTYNNLNHKDRRFSNEFSRRIWGLDVPNVYKLNLSKLSSDIEEPSGLAESVDYNYTDNGYYNFIESVFANDDKISKLLLRLDAKSMPINEAMKIRTIASESDTNFKDIIIQGSVPYFTIDEMRQIIGADMSGQNVEDEISNYRSMIQARLGNNEDVAKFGWNPSVPFDIAKAHLVAKNRQAKWLANNGAKVYDVINLSNKTNGEEKNLYPVYWLDVIPSDPTQQDNSMDISINLDTFVSIKIVDGKQIISKKRFDNYDQDAYVKIYVTYVAPEYYDKIYNNLKNLEQFNTINILDCLMNSAFRKYLPEFEALKATKFVYLLRQIALDKEEYNSREFLSAKVYKIFSGKIADLVGQRSNMIDKMESILRIQFKEDIEYHGINCNMLYESSNKEDVDAIFESILNMITPESII